VIRAPPARDRRTAERPPHHRSLTGRVVRTTGRRPAASERRAPRLVPCPRSSSRRSLPRRWRQRRQGAPRPSPAERAPRARQARVPTRAPYRGRRRRPSQARPRRARARAVRRASPQHADGCPVRSLLGSDSRLRARKRASTTRRRGRSLRRSSSASRRGREPGQTLGLARQAVARRVGGRVGQHRYPLSDPRRSK
jgi:hypothetical protein